MSDPLSSLMGNHDPAPDSVPDRRCLTELAHEQGVEGVICGHYHMAGLHDRHGLVYANYGDWVTSINCLSEDYNGRQNLVDGRAVQIFDAGLLPETQVVHA